MSIRSRAVVTSMMTSTTTSATTPTIISKVTIGSKTTTP